MKRATLILTDNRSCNALLHTIPVFVFSHLKSVLRHKFLILDTLYLRQQECENPCTESIITPSTQRSAWRWPYN